MRTQPLTRRALLAGSAASAAALALPESLMARTAPAGRQAAGVYRYRIGEFELTALYDGIWHRPVDATFVRNAPFAEFQQAMADAFLPDPHKLPFSMTVLAVNTGAKLVLLDSGTGGQLGPSTGSLAGNLKAAGIAPEAVDVIAISHFHPDHINGIKDKDGGLVFPNAEIMVSEPEWNFWMDDAVMSRAPDALQTNFRNARRIFRSIARQVTRVTPGRDIVPGIASMPAFGHTAGHIAFALASGNQSMLVLGDTANHPLIFARNPEWQPVIDVDGPLAVETRKRLLDRAAADRMLIGGFHFPFPACGHILKRGAGYDYVPAMWQPTL